MQEKIIGPKAQRLLRSRSAAVIGLGGIGCMSAQLLARSGVGSLILVDKDIVDVTNLNRQILYDMGDVGKSKPKAAAAKIRRINPDVKVKALDLDINKGSISRIRADIILDCTDNFRTKKLIADHALAAGIPWVFASAVGTKGMVRLVEAGDDWFFRAFSGKKRFIGTARDGIMNTASNSAACIQATEAIKHLVGCNNSPHLIRFDIWKGEMENISF